MLYSMVKTSSKEFPFNFGNKKESSDRAVSFQIGRWNKYARLDDGNSNNRRDGKYFGFILSLFRVYSVFVLQKNVRKQGRSQWLHNMHIAWWKSSCNEVVNYLSP